MGKGQPYRMAGVLGWYFGTSGPCDSTGVPQYAAEDWKHGIIPPAEIKLNYPATCQAQRSAQFSVTAFEFGHDLKIGLPGRKL